MSHPPAPSREELHELLALTPGDDLVALADTILATGVNLRVTRRPETGSIAVQVREPVARQRFQLADMVVSTAEVELAGERGWAMRSGTDRRAALAQAVCEAELARNGSHAAQIRARLESEATDRSAQRAQEWSALLPTIVEFEEVL